MIGRLRYCFAVTMLSLALIMPATATSFASNDVASAKAPASCPVTRPSEPAFIPPGPYPQAPPSAPHSFWHGTPALWTMLRSSGVLTGMMSTSRDRPGAFSTTREKVFWWSPGYHPISNPGPDLKIEGRRLDGDAPKLAQPWVTNARVPEWGGWTMLIMLELPTQGCWEVTGSYGSDSVTFVVWVA